MTHNVLKQKVINQRIERLQRAKIQLQEKRLRESFTSSQYLMQQQSSPNKVSN